MRRLTTIGVVLTLAACAPPPPPPEPAAPREGTTVRASFGRTWDAAIDVLAEQHLRTRTLDRSSGLIVLADAAYSRADETEGFATCRATLFNVLSHPKHGQFNLVVRGDSMSSHVVARAVFSVPVASKVYDCPSRGAWEAEVEQSIKARAERGAR